jgi:hypothetical protein
LFSRGDVAAAINRWFEPAWEEVRSVPIVRIDFGNGTVLTRTLHGNIATHVCGADGQTLDVLPGIYEPATYLDRLDQFRLLASFVNEHGPERRAERLREYHRGQAEALKKGEVQPRLANLAGMSKRVIESGVKAVLVAGTRRPRPAPAGGAPRLESAEDVASWQVLAEDTRVNETVHRRQIHERLAAPGPAGPGALTKWLYKEVLHADLDDPYLGLGGVLFARYPFQDERSK